MKLEKLKLKTVIYGVDPITGMVTQFVSYEPYPGSSNVLFIIEGDWYYSTDAGITWEVNPVELDIRQIDMVVTKEGQLCT